MSARDIRPPRPIEILEQIIDWIWVMHREDGDFYAVDLQPTWNACASTCRALAPRSQYWIFREIFLDKEHQAFGIRRLLQRNPRILENSRSLTIWKYYQNDHDTWISWIPQVLLPHMKKLEEVRLNGDLLLKAHPSLLRALSAFKSIRMLELYSVNFSLFDQCSHLMQAFPRLQQLRCLYLSWKPTIPQSPPSAQPVKVRRNSLHLRHLDLWSDSRDSRDLITLASWFGVRQSPGIILTMSVQMREGRDDVALASILRRGTNARSIFLEFQHDYPVTGFNHCHSLEKLHLRSFQHEFPVQVLTSILHPAPFRTLETVYIYLNPDRVRSQHTHSSTTEAYTRLDDALCNPTLKKLELVLILFSSTSEAASGEWAQKLVTCLPKFSASGRIRVERTRDDSPITTWTGTRDGF